MSELVSIIVPVFNMEDTIESSVNSIRNQTYKNIEIILIDDGSTDDSYSICKLMEKTDYRLKAYHTNNMGSGPARNYGIKKASGSYVYFPDADDYLDPNAIGILVEAASKGKYDLVVFGFNCANSKGEIFRTKKYKKESQNGDNIRRSYSKYMTVMSEYGIQGAPWNKFFSLSLIKENDITYPPLRRHQDEGFIAHYMCFACSVLFVSDVLYTYYVNDLKKEWQKYPVDYINAVIGLYETRKQTIMRWNPDDAITHEMIQREYICNVIKSLELSFSPKINYNKKQRKEWIDSLISKSKIEIIDTPSILQQYQSLVLRLIKGKRHILLYYTLLLKLNIQTICQYVQNKLH